MNVVQADLDRTKRMWNGPTYSSEFLTSCITYLKREVKLHEISSFLLLARLRFLCDNVDLQLC